MTIALIKDADASLATTAPSAGTMTADGGNAGDGTADAVTALLAASETETFTFTCDDVATPASEEFEIVGSISGALTPKLVTGVELVHAKLTATINDGAANWEIGDIWTVLITRTPLQIIDLSKYITDFEFIEDRPKIRIGVKEASAVGLNLMWTNANTTPAGKIAGTSAALTGRAIYGNHPPLEIPIENNFLILKALDGTATFFAEVLD